ncbi:MAG: M15 family metallopeptidase [Myxococcota bacterium]
MRVQGLASNRRKLTLFGALALFAGSASAAALSGCERESEAPPERLRVGVSRSAATLGDIVTDHSCSTSVVLGLSYQIIGQASCAEPDAFALVAPGDGVTYGPAVLPYMIPAARDALIAALKSPAAPDEELRVNSMFRSVAQQLLLYQWYQAGECGISLAARPGRSPHESGLAIDVGNYEAWRTALESVDFDWLGEGDPWHFDYEGPEAVSYLGLDVLAFQQLWNVNHPEDPIAEDGAYGPQTEARLLLAPPDGFPLGPTCEEPIGPPPREPLLELSWVDASDRFADGPSEGAVDLFLDEPAKLRLEVVAGTEGIEEGTPARVAFAADARTPDLETEVPVPALIPGARVGFDIEFRPNAATTDFPTPGRLAVTVEGAAIETAVDVYDPMEFRWDNGRLEGWRASEETTLAATPDGTLSIRGRNADTPDELSLTAAEVTRIHIRGKRDSGGRAGVVIALDGSAFADGIPVATDDWPADGRWHDIAADVDLPVDAQTRITGLRIVVSDSTATTAEVDEVRIERIGLQPAPPGPSPAETPSATDGSCAIRTLASAPRKASYEGLFFLAAAAAGTRRRRRGSGNRYRTGAGFE